MRNLLVQKYLILIIFFLFFLIGCASVPIKETFDPSNFDYMNNVALLVRKQKVDAIENPWLGPFSKKTYETPIVWYIDNTWASKPTTVEVPVGRVEDWIVSLGYSFASPFGDSLAVDKKRTQQLYNFIKDYNIKENFRSVFIREFEKIKSFNILPFESVEEIYKNRCNFLSDKLDSSPKDEFIHQQQDFVNDLIKVFGADTLILLDIGLWGFYRQTSWGFLTTKGNFTICVNIKIIRLSDEKIIWNSFIFTDFSEGKFKKENRKLEEFFEDDEPLFLDTMNELVNTTAHLLIEELRQ